MDVSDSKTARFKTCAATPKPNHISPAPLREAMIAVTSPRNSSAAAPCRTRRSLSIGIHRSAKRLAAPEAISPTSAQDEPAAYVHAATTVPAAAAPTTCSTGLRVTSETVLDVSVSTASVPKSGHGGSDHDGLVETTSRNRGTMRPRYRPSPNPTAWPLVFCPHRFTRARPANVTSARPVRTASEGTTPTAAPARIHQLASTIQDKRLPATDT